MTIDDQINNFLRDASWRISELSIEINEKKNSDKNFREEAEMRAELAVFMDLLYDVINPIRNDYTLLKTDWPEREIILEMEYLREQTQMAEIPYITFTGYAPTISVTPTDEEETSVSGNLGEIVTYNVSSDPVNAPFPQSGGMNTNESIDEYFG